MGVAILGTMNVMGCICLSFSVHLIFVFCCPSDSRAGTPGTAQQHGGTADFQQTGEW